MCLMPQLKKLFFFKPTGPGLGKFRIGPRPRHRRRTSASSDMVTAIFFPSTAVASSTSSDSASSSVAPSYLSAPFSPVVTVFVRRSILAFVFVTALVFLYRSTLLPFSYSYTSTSTSSSSLSSTSSTSSSIDFVFPPDAILAEDKEYSLQKVLKEAATGDNTVIITTLNEAWSAPSSILDLFLESFRIGNHTRSLLNHLIIVALDPKAFRRCIQLHPHCFALVTEGIDFSEEAYFMTPDYLKMMWRRIDFLRSVLEMGYNFLFTDADIMWFRNPFPRLYPDADFQIACDRFSGNSSDLGNMPNGGFNYVKSNNRSIEFYRFWYSSQERYPGYHDQDVLNFIKHDPYINDIGLSIRFLNTAFFGGFCEPSKDLNLVCTMHANCCFGMDSKLHDLRIMLQDWRRYMSRPPSLKRSLTKAWRVPMNCSLHSRRRIAPSPKHDAPSPKHEESKKI